MAMGKFILTDTIINKIRKGATAADAVDLTADTIKAALFTSAAALTSAIATYGALSNEVANGNGYTTGGVTLTGKTFVVDGVDPSKWIFDFDAFTWTASGADLTARWVVIYSDTPTNKTVIGFALLDATPADVVTPDGFPLTITPPASGVFDMVTDNA